MGDCDRCGRPFADGSTVCTVCTSAADSLSNPGQTVFIGEESSASTGSSASGKVLSKRQLKLRQRWRPRQQQEQQQEHQLHQLESEQQQPQEPPLLSDRAASECVIASPHEAGSTPDPASSIARPDSRGEGNGNSSAEDEFFSAEENLQEDVPGAPDHHLTGNDQSTLELPPSAHGSSDGHSERSGGDGSHSDSSLHPRLTSSPGTTHTEEGNNGSRHGSQEQFHLGEEDGGASNSSDQPNDDHTDDAGSRDGQQQQQQ
eukprot:scpid98829/ scgid15502/ 